MNAWVANFFLPVLYLLRQYLCWSFHRCREHFRDIAFCSPAHCLGKESRARASFQWYHRRSLVALLSCNDRHCDWSTSNRLWQRLLCHPQNVSWFFMILKRIRDVRRGYRTLLVGPRRMCVSDNATFLENDRLFHSGWTKEARRQYYLICSCFLVFSDYQLVDRLMINDGWWMINDWWSIHKNSQICSKSNQSLFGRKNNGYFGRVSPGKTDTRY